MRLRRSRLEDPGIRRLVRGRGFAYVGPDGRPVHAADKDRIRRLGIPPAWSEVWISPDERGHIQATGIDAAGRKQYVYHPDWRRRRDVDKFERMARFGARLVAARGVVRRHLRRDPSDRRAVLAACFRILDETLIRVGGEQYAKASGALGLATLRRSSCRFTDDGRAWLTFRGKSGIGHELEVADPQVVRVLSRMVERVPTRRGDPALLAWRDESGWHPVRSRDINHYVQDVMGEEFSAKDFRTWHASVTAAQVLAHEGAPTSSRDERRAVREAMAAAAERLGNSPAVARSAYVDPRLVEEFAAGRLPEVRGRSPERLLLEVVG